MLKQLQATGFLALRLNYSFHLNSLFSGSLCGIFTFAKYRIRALNDIYYLG